MPTFAVQLARLVREVTYIRVEASSEAELEKRLDEVYRADITDELDWESDDMWGCDEGNHSISGLDKTGEPPHLILGEENEDA